MKTLTILKGVAAVALLTSFGAANASSHLPSPCATGQAGDGFNCMWITLASSSGTTSGPDGTTGDRVATSNSLTYTIEVWMDFHQDNLQGGFFDIDFDTTNVTSMTWAWGAGIENGQKTANGSQTTSGWTAVGINDFNTSGFYLDGFDNTNCSPNGDMSNDPATCHADGFQMVGTLTLSVTAGNPLLFSLASPYPSNQQPTCFAAGANSPNANDGQCDNPNFYNLTVDVQAVPLPAAVWMMLAGLGSLAGFSRRRKS